jgi:DNA replication licensing factor MCM7
MALSLPPIYFTAHSYLRNYHCRHHRYDPIISPDLLNHIVGAYLTMRKAMIENPDIQYTGARTLLAVLRLSTSIARLHFRDTVEKDDVDEALRLMHASKSSIDDSKEGEREVGDPTDEIFQILTTLRAASGSDEIDLEAAKQQTVREGFNPDQFDDTVAQYQDHNVLMVNEAQTKIVFV